MQHSIKSWLMTVALVLSVTSCATFKPTPTAPVNVDSLIETMPAQSPQALVSFGDTIFDQGTGAVTAICNQLVPAGTGDDTKARFALSGLAKHASRPGAGRDRKVFVTSVLAALNAQSDWEVQSFLINQLQLTGKNESVKTLSGYLADKDLGSHATAALQAIGTRKATAAIHAAALSASTDAQRVVLMKSLAALKHRPALPVFEQYASNADRDVRFAALLGLATLANPRSEATLKAATQSGSTYDKIEAEALYGLYTRNIASR